MMSVPRGWYPDPQYPGKERWWDGTGWTAKTRFSKGRKRPGRISWILCIVTALLALAVLVITANVGVGFLASPLILLAALFALKGWLDNRKWAKAQQLATPHI
jgi:hypothetical protein